MDSPDAKTRILDAAERAFADSGRAGARVAAIADEADVNKAMLYYYFGNKEELYLAVLTRVADQVAALGVSSWVDVEPDVHTVATFLRGYRAILAAHPDFARLMMRELLDGGEHLPGILGPRIGRVLPAVFAAVQKGQTAGTVNPAVDPLLVGPAMISPVIFFAFASPLLAKITGVEGDALSDAYHQTVEALLLQGLVARTEEAP